MKRTLFAVAVVVAAGWFFRLTRRRAKLQKESNLSDQGKSVFVNCHFPQTAVMEAMQHCLIR